MGFVSFIDDSHLRFANCIYEPSGWASVMVMAGVRMVFLTSYGRSCYISVYIVEWIFVDVVEFCRRFLPTEGTLGLALISCMRSLSSLLLT